MRGINLACIELICLDPHFNFYEDRSAGAAFKITWALALAAAISSTKSSGIVACAHARRQGSHNELEPFGAREWNNVDNVKVEWREINL